MRRSDRRSICLRGHDHRSPGAYFMPLVAYRREALFGEIGDGAMRWNRSGNILSECWQAISARFSRVELERK